MLFRSVSKLTATTPQDFTVAQGPLTIKVTNSTSNVPFVLYGCISTGSGPTWVTPSGSLGFFGVGTAGSTTLVATDPDAGATITYSIVSGSLPAGMSLASTTGVISGTPTTGTIYSFTARATDNAGNYSNQPFSIQTYNYPTGGTITTVSGYKYHTFTTSSSLEIGRAHV